MSIKATFISGSGEVMEMWYLTLPKQEKKGVFRYFPQCYGFFTFKLIH